MNAHGRRHVVIRMVAKNKTKRGVVVMTLNIEQILSMLSVIERDYEESYRRNKEKGDVNMAEWYDGAANGILRAKELIIDEVSSN